MKTTLSTHDIAHSLLQDSNANWSSCGAFALANYLEEMEASTGDEIELDVVAIRCDFSEYASLRDWADEYGMEEDSTDYSFDDKNDAIRAFITDNGTLIEFDGGIIVSSF